VQRSVIMMIQTDSVVVVVVLLAVWMWKSHTHNAQDVRCDGGCLVY
jgi:hypothetical protein